MNWRAAKTSAGLCLLFMLVYGGTNWLTGLRHDVGTFYFEWERRIPFVPVMIVPYISIDLLFVAAPFLCADVRERRVFSKRIIAAILIAGCCFLLFPLRFAFDRPHTDGLLGAVFDRFRAMDQPFNQFPSLHIALRTILAVLYVKHTRGIVRWTTRIWFSLIGFSTLLTYQHHVIDLIGGFVLAGLCIYFIREESIIRPVVCNRRVGIYYAAGSMMLALVATLLRRWGLFLLWPALSMALMSAAYFRLGAGIFYKQNGKLPPIVRVVFWPILVAQRLSLVYYASRSNPWDKVDEHLWIGRKLTSTEAARAVAEGVSAVLDLTCEFTEAAPFRAVNYLQLPVLDLTAPPMESLDRAVEFVRGQSAIGVVYIHCKAGYSRTAGVTGGYLLATGRVPTADDAIALLRSARTGMIVRPEIARCLREYEEKLRGKKAPAHPRTPGLPTDESRAE